VLDGTYPGVIFSGGCSSSPTSSNVLLRHCLLPQPGGFASGARVGHADGLEIVAVRHVHAPPVFVDEKHLETGVVDLLVSGFLGTCAYLDRANTQARLAALESESVIMGG
jgi:hypothetical protein